MNTTNTTFLSELRRKMVSSPAFIAVELALILALIAANQLNIIRVPLSLTLPLILMGWLSLRLRGSGWHAIGLRRPERWRTTIPLALLIAVVHQGASTFVLIPFLQQVSGQPIDLSLVDQIEGNLVLLGVGVVIAWLLAGFGEEMVYRGYILNRFADLFKSRPAGWLLGYIVSVLLFSWIHQYQGTVGIIDSIVSGALWGGLYFLAGRRLWLPILSHGFYDTIAFVFAYFGII